MAVFKLNNSSRTCLNHNLTFMNYKNQLREKYFDYSPEKVLKIGTIKGKNTNLKPCCAFGNDQTQNILHPYERLCP